MVVMISICYVWFQRVVQLRALGLFVSIFKQFIEKLKTYQLFLKLGRFYIARPCWAHYIKDLAKAKSFYFNRTILYH